MLGNIIQGIFAGFLLYESYVRLPQQFLYGSSPTSLPAFNEKSVFIIFPGFGGPDLNTKRIEEMIKASDATYSEKRYTATYDWTKWRGNTIRAAFDGEMVGQLIGKQLKERRDTSRKIQNLHVIGVSVGAFAANACIDEFSKQNMTGIATRLTLLDPFTCKGLFGQGYGLRRFGVNAKFCENFFNSDDPVPFTNEPLPHAYNYDVTESRQRASFTPLPGDNMHSWPAAFFGLNWKSIDPRNMKNRISSSIYINSHQKYPRGTLKKL